MFFYCSTSMTISIKIHVPYIIRVLSSLVPNPIVRFTFIPQTKNAVPYKLETFDLSSSLSPNGIPKWHRCPPSTVSLTPLRHHHSSPNHLRRSMASRRSLKHQFGLRVHNSRKQLAFSSDSHRIQLRARLYFLPGSG